MSRDPYGGSIWDPASLHRYNYARANPVNYIDPSGRADLTEYEFALVDVLPTIGEVAFVGQQVACDYSVMASILDIIFDAPYANGEQMQLASIQLDKSLGKCGVKATWKGNLLNIGLILASYDFGGFLGDAEEGFSLRFTTEEEGSLGLGRSIVFSDGVAASNWQGYEQAVRDLYGGNQSFQARQFTALVDGVEEQGVADAVTTVNNVPTAVEAKFTGNWGSSIYNPGSPIGQAPFAQEAQQTMISQAATYSNGFEGGVIYHTNSPQLAAYYTQAFEQAGITNFQFVITPSY